MSALGPRGLTVLSIAGVAGVFLGVLGWGQRGTGLIAPVVAAPPSATASPSAASSGSASPSAAPSGSASPSAAGPLLSSQPYGSYAYQVWPGPLSADARLAMDGITLTVTRQANGITVRATVDGQSTGAAHFFQGGAKVYVVDSSLGDEGGSVDYNVGDDGLVITNAQGQMLS